MLAVASIGHSDAPDFARDVAPLLQKYCVGCHNEDDAKGKLRLDQFDAIAKGGKRGAALVAGKSAESLLVKLVDGTAKPRMPPGKNPKPTAAEWLVVKAWIDAGAKPSQTGSTSPANATVKSPTVQPTKKPTLGVQALATLPGKKLLAVARYNAVEVIDLSSNHLLASLTGHAGPVTSLAFSNDGSLLIAAGGKPGQFGEVRIWQVADHKLRRTIRGHRDSLYAAEISRDGKLLATAGYDKEIQLWDVATGASLRKLTGHNDAVYSLAFRRDGKILASASGDRTVKLWDVATGKRLDTFSQPTKELHTVVFDPAGDRVYAAGADNRIRAWSVSDTAKEGSNPLIHSRFAHQSPILKLAISSDGKSLASSAEDRTIKIWNALALSERSLLERQSDWASALAFTGDDKSLVAGRHDGGLTTYNVAKGVKETDVRAKKMPMMAKSAMAPAKPDASEAQFFGSLPRVVVDNAAGSKPMHLAKTPAAASGVIVKSGDAHSFSFDAKKGQTIVVDVQANAIGSKLNAIASLFDPAGREIAASNDFDGKPDPLLVHTIAADGRYIVRIADSQYTGGPEHRYRVAIGPLAVVTGVYPPSAKANQKSSFQLAGFNLPPDAKIDIALGMPGTETVVSLDSKLYRQRRDFKVLAESGPVVAEVEPNNTPTTATVMSAPGVAVGRIYRQASTSSSATDEDYFRFHAKAGTKWIIETDAARRGLPTDTRIEVLDTTGKPIERLVLQAVRDSNITFRGTNSTSPDIRVRNWEEMELNEFMYFKGEVCKIFRLPQGPDSGFLFYNVGGRRLAYFDSSSVAHAVNDDCYIVQPLPPGAQPIPNGLPTFSVHYVNDDSGDRKLGGDSQLTFTAPKDGDYLVKVADVRGMEGDRFCYRLIVREPKPDFTVSLAGVNPDVSPGSGRSITVVADRIDGFDGDIRVELSDLPRGFFASNPTVVQAGHLEAQMVLWTAKDAPQPKPEDWAKVKVLAAAAVDGSPVEKKVGVASKAIVDRMTPPRARGKATKVTSDLARVKLGAAPKLTVRLEPAEVVIAPGTTVTAQLIVERHGFDDRINFSVNNLPHGVIVANIGLNGILIPKGQSRREIFLTARNWVPEATRPFFAVANVDNNQASPPIVLKVRRPKELADAKPAGP